MEEKFWTDFNKYLKNTHADRIKESLNGIFTTVFLKEFNDTKYYLIIFVENCVHITLAIQDNYIKNNNNDNNDDCVNSIYALIDNDNQLKHEIFLPLDDNSTQYTKEFIEENIKFNEDYARIYFNECEISL